MRALLVRLSSIGDVVHTLPALAALHRHGWEADWLVEPPSRVLLDLNPLLAQVQAAPSRKAFGWGKALATVGALRSRRYDAALDFQGLMKSAVFARASGARRVIGFSIWHLREKSARPFYSETAGTDDPDDEEVHVIRKNLRLLRSVGVISDRIAFPLARVDSPAAREVASQIAGPFVLVNPGAAWPNKRWPSERFGEVAAFLREVRGLSSVVLWGPGEEALARAVVEQSSGAARLAPPTRVADLLELSRTAALMV